MRITDQILSIVIVFFVNIALNLLASSLLSTKGTVDLRVVSTSNELSAVTLRVENHSNEPIYDLEMLIPQHVDIANIFSSNPVQFTYREEVISDKALKPLTISLIPAKKVTTIMFFVRNDGECCIITNSSAVNLSNTSTKEAESPLYTVFLEIALPNAFIATVVLAFIFLIIGTHEKKIENRLEEASRKLAEAKEENERAVQDARDAIDAFKNKLSKAAEESNFLRDEMVDIKKQAASRLVSQQRVKLILFKRLSDYSKELTFWRGVVGKILHSQINSKKEVSDFFRRITQELKTYSTLAGTQSEMEDIEEMAKILMDYDNKDK